MFLFYVLATLASANISELKHICTIASMRAVSFGKKITFISPYSLYQWKVYTFASNDDNNNNNGNSNDDNNNSDDDYNNDSYDNLE